ncbi:hypothetical protein BP00DRAFT_115364 [Aspergillus indologenus CBS 114.80]|uniref:Uncharacterized protein n=1 Tax=Aspergillus indologenus CBS 114.80 TaxID=1450541 RepID=A0A2V5HUL1_9EURO|nr:hypothetical protein BP00DRAFT_115364 [Aspergillus indologenus CBS 114.80]
MCSSCCPDAFLERASRVQQGLRVPILTGLGNKRVTLCKSVPAVVDGATAMFFTVPSVRAGVSSRCSTMSTISGPAADAISCSVCFRGTWSSLLPSAAVFKIEGIDHRYKVTAPTRVLLQNPSGRRLQTNPNQAVAQVPGLWISNWLETLGWLVNEAAVQIVAWR